MIRHEFLSSVSQLSDTEWNALWDTSYPFTQHAFLLALESTGCTTESSGWRPAHLVCYENDTLVGAVILYIKVHSYGEYVFDWSWADAYHQHGLEYYPKLVNAIPFTPATGPRVSISRKADLETVQRYIISAIHDYCLRSGFSGFHILFPEENGVALTPTDEAPMQLATRFGCQFHWLNQGYKHFDDFLCSFTARKRKSLSKERRRVSEAGFTIQACKGDALCESDWLGFYELYKRTYLKRSGHTGYLSCDFFLHIGRYLTEHTLMIKAYLNEQWVAGALYFYDDSTLYGRYWGAIDEFDGLHFECCYYQGIDYAIQRGLHRFDPGAQGEHKIQRGFTPILTQSKHWLTDARFQAGILGFLKQEERQVKCYCEEARQYLPFKEGTALIEPDILIKRDLVSACLK